MRAVTNNNLVAHILLRLLHKAANFSGVLVEHHDAVFARFIDLKWEKKTWTVVVSLRLVMDGTRYRYRSVFRGTCSLRKIEH
jgi:hypothetical protein